MNNRTNSGGSILLWIIAVGLLIFTGARSVHLVQFTLPPDAQALAFAALAALDGGLLAWLFWTTRAAKGGAQRTIGTLMIVVDLAGITAATLADTMLIANPDGAAGMISMVAIWIVPVVILANVIGVVVAHVVDPAQTLRDAQRALEDELQWQLAESLRANAGQVAAGAVPEAVAHKQAEMVASFLSAAKSRARAGTPMVSLNTDGEPVEAKPGRNGRPKG